VAQPFGSLWKMLHFCIATEGELKMYHRYEASVGDRICELQCVLKTILVYGVIVGIALSSF
jgi:hypothetical protein